MPIPLHTDQYVIQPSKHNSQKRLLSTNKFDLNRHI